MTHLGYTGTKGKILCDFYVIELGEPGIKDKADNQRSREVTRDQVISAIYESVISPGRFESFLDLWGQHIQDEILPPSSHAPGAPLEKLEDAKDLERPGQDAELQEHFARAYQILEQIGRKVPLVGVLDSVRSASGLVVALSPQGEILAQSSRFKDWALGADGLVGLTAELSAPSATLLETLLEQMRRDGPIDETPVVLTTGRQPRHLIARMIEATPEGPEGLKGAGRYLVVEALEFYWTPRAEQMLVVSFGLSRAEVGIVRHLMAGHSLREIAQQTGKSEHTVRNQSKSILAKTGAPGQVELIRLVAFLVNEELRTKPGVGAIGALHFDVINMREGRRLQVFRAGREGGTPVIFMHGMLDATAAVQFLGSRFDAEDYHVIAPMRPGFGLSDPVIRPETVMDVVTDQVRELIQREHLHQPLILGHLAGGIYGHVLAHRLRGQIAGLVAVSSGAPVTRLSDIGSMSTRVRIMAYTARFTPALLPAVLRAGIAMIDSNDVDAFMDAQFPDGTIDRQTIKQLNLASLIQDGYRLSVKQGAAGFASDSYWALRDWGQLAAGPICPTIYLHGGQDPVNKAYRIKQAMSGLPDIQVRIWEELGQLMFYERPDLVFAALRELALQRR